MPSCDIILIVQDRGGDIVAQIPLKDAFQKARAKLAKADPAILSEQTGIAWSDANRQFSFSSLGKRYTVSYPEGEVREDNGREASPTFALLTLHYLLSGPTLPLGEWISFKEIPGASIYQGPFEARTIGRLFRKVSQLVDLAKACEKLDGRKMPGGDLAFRFELFPRLPVGLVCWEGDDEFPPSGNMLFDANAKSFLTPEDYAVIGEYIIGQLLKELT